MYEKIILKLH